MKLLTTTIAAVLLVGCGTTQPTEPPTAKAPDISIHDAAFEGNIEAVKQHIAAGADVNAKTEDGWTPLDLAASRGRKEIAELLIENGADVNAKAMDGGTPLHYAATKEIAELLISKGADVNAKDEYGDTPLDLATHPSNPNASPETADLLRKHGGKTGQELKAGEPVAEAASPEPPTAKAPDISIGEAAEVGNIEFVKQAIADGADVNAKGGQFGGTPLYDATWNGHKEVAELLLANGADVSAKNKFGFTPLHNAAMRGHKEIAKLLIAEGADVNAKTKDNTTPLDLATEYNQTEIADILRKHGAKTPKELEAAGK